MRTTEQTRSSTGWPSADPVRLAVGGLLLTASGLAIYVVLGTLLGEQNAPGFSVPLLLALTCAWLVPRRRWVLPVVALVALGFLAVAALDPFRLTHPDNFLDFAPSVVIMAGLLVVVAGWGLGLLQDRSRTAARTDTIVRSLSRVGALLLAAVVIASAFLTLAPTRRVTADEDVLVLTTKSTFVPDEIEATPGGRILVRNEDWFAHTFTVVELGISEYIGPRGERLIDLPDAAPGTYELTCAVVGHWGMDGRLTVEREP